MAEQGQCCLCSRCPPVSHRQLADVEAVLALQIAVAALQQLDAAIGGIQLHLQGKSALLRDSHCRSRAA